MRPSRLFDQPRSLLEAVKAKYGTSVESKTKASGDPIIIGGKQVNEVGFEKIAQQQSAWSDLPIVSLDGLRINCLFSKTSKLELPPNSSPGDSLKDLKWKELSLANNLFDSWADIFELRHFVRELSTLGLDGNRFVKISQEADFPTGTFEQIQRLKLDSPLTASHPNARLLSIARIPLLESLNHTTITSNERQDAELYYMKLIADLMLGAKTTEESNQFRREHPAWDYLCVKHGEPESIIHKQKKNDPALQPKYPPVSLGANLIRFIFVHRVTLGRPPSLPETTTDADLSFTGAVYTRDLPKQVDIYRLKSIVGRLFSIPARHTKLILETNEWDPVPTTQLGGLDWDSSSDDDDSDAFLDISGGWDRADNGIDDPSAASKPDDPGILAEKTRKKQEREERKKERWVKREMEIPDSTRSIGDWVEGETARVRVERLVERSLVDMGVSAEALHALEQEMLMR
ncbi:MAG: hypothetical protein LQ352_002421 [Teloschistes flavicans]|nr:MAG: hypothetical protein LQ352_002421 [Teloschistes flavicans]